MKVSLRHAYFGWLLLLLLFSYSLLLFVLSAIELHESRAEHTSFKNEMPEIAAFFIVMAATVPVIVFVAWHIAGRLLRPLHQVVTTAEHIRRGNFDERIPPLPHEDELARLADTINEAFDRYASAVRRLENFSGDASHQLRTPLTAIKGAAEVALQSGRREEEYRETLGEILEQTAKLNETVEQLLLLSRLDQSMRDTFRPLPVVGIVQDWITEARKAMDDIRITPAIDAPGDLVIRGNEVLLHQVFSNLVDNARAFTPPGGEILIGLHLDAPGQLVWRVEDSGPGIPEGDRHRVFDRFFRGRQSAHKGSGLGLAIVREVVMLHGGTIRAEQSARLGGAAMVIQLPCG